MASRTVMGMIRTPQTVVFCPFTTVTPYRQRRLRPSGYSANPKTPSCPSSDLCEYDFLFRATPVRLPNLGVSR